MKKIIVIGCPGSGKSTFSQSLHQITELPLYHLDRMNWNSDKTTVPKEVFLERLRETIAEDAWIIDGNYGSSLELRIQACDTVFFLDYPVKVCLEGVMERRGKERPDMPWVESVDHIDEEFIEFIQSYREKSRPGIVKLLDDYRHKEIIVFKNRQEADQFLSTND